MIALEPGLARHLGESPRVDRWIAVRAPRVDPVALWDDDFAGSQTLWAPRQGACWIAWDDAAVVRGEGDARFDAVREGGARMLSRLARGGDEDAPAPRLFGGFAFRAGRHDEQWATHGDALFALPRLAYVVNGNGAHFVAALLHDDAPSVVASTLASLARVERRLATVPTLATGAQPRVVRDDDATSVAAYRALVIAALDQIDAGAFAKVVVARSRRLLLDAPPSMARILSALPAGATRFAFSRQGRCFVGATPELLCSLTDGILVTEALAGTAAKGPGAAVALLENAKQRAEQEFVLNDVLAAVGGLGASAIERSPLSLRNLAHVVHLATTIRARVPSTLHVLTAVEHLHPTPAVGGVPRATAAAWLGTHEPIDRGWYAGPVGWFDDAGDGDFRVGLRSALVADAEVRLFAGAGILAGSDPAQESHETGLKLRAMLAGLELAP